MVGDGWIVETIAEDIGWRVLCEACRDQLVALDTARLPF